MGERRAAVRPAVAELARAIRENARSTDFVGRIAPDALAVLFASARAETMSEWADAVRASFARRTRAVTLTIDLVDLAAPAVSRERQRPR
jgi:GGDEF domain-containing protein